MNYTDAQIVKAKTSPALTRQGNGYPTRYNGQVPAEIKMLQTVRSGMPFGSSVEPLLSGQTYPCWVNSYGAVSGIDKNGEALGVISAEFEVVAYWGMEGWKL